MGDEYEQKIRDLQRFYVDFLDDSDDQGIYSKLVRDMVESKGTRLIVSINDLRRANPERAKGLMNNSFEEVAAFQRALKEFVGSIDSIYAREKEDFFVGFEGSFGSKHVTARTLNARLLGSLVCLEGIVTKCSQVKPKVVKSVHYCPATEKTIERTYTDLTSLDAYPSTAAYPTQDEDGNPLQTEFGDCKFKDHQTLTLQEMPEKAPTGQLPRNCDVILDNDMVDAAKPGDRVQVVGCFRCLPNKQQGYTGGTFRTVVIANNITLLSKEVTPNITGKDVHECKKFSKQKGSVFDILSKSLAPSIHGHEFVKKALLCMLLGGVERNLPNGTRLRGDINILLIGDPSVAKSQLLRYVLNTAPRAIATTGRGSSGVGLTAAVTTDKDTGERQLEAGAMVLADRGVVCIDEFDKMTDVDRTAIHEVMEQGRVTISKAGIHASLNARCSVLAAANPVYGRYNPYKSPMENIGLQDSLLSRFDLLFILLDTIDVDNDRKIADHVVRMHRYRNPNEQDGEVLSIAADADVLTTKDLEGEEDENEETPMYEKYDALLHGNSRKKSDKIVSVQFMKKYIHIAKCIRPAMTDEASSIIAEEYADLRTADFANDMARTQPVTARALETLIRLATAHAKARLSKVVEEEDAETAIQLVQFAYFKKVLTKSNKRRKRDDGSEDEEGMSQEDEEGDEEIRPTPSKKPRKGSAEGISVEESELLAATAAASKPATVEVSSERYKHFMSLLYKLVQENYQTQSLEMQQIYTFMERNEKQKPFSEAEIDVVLDRMQDENKVMRSGETIYII
ncbi:DNA replication licensing factor MCM3 [Eurytemora carolleeae]|uniref:DNA replication licensing factor MCM3 n=1 Tax=Eurytemora carolleeae TaxID=1294199 RepID=UPI000C77F2F6|nr:DNA replication licensing factor MCM3 [Eurytemora carolleeae]|eukprot:XP_023339006.1 DNA replication licensing factor MCM3-like [Eurytemora affinis]